MTTPVELRALADNLFSLTTFGKPDSNAILSPSRREELVAVLRSAADRIEELEKALEQAKREENEACAKIAEKQCVSYNIDDCQENALWNECLQVAAAIRSRYPAQAQGEKDETK